MKVRMLQCQAGSDFVRSVGDTIDVDDAEGARMVDAQIAEAIGPETATTKPQRTAAKPKGVKRESQARNGPDK